MKIRDSGQFKKDYKKCKKRGLNMELLKTVIAILAKPAALPWQYKDHGLSGDYTGYRECHITPDWLLIYRYKDDFLELIRTGTHSDLFKR